MTDQLVERCREGVTDLEGPSGRIAGLFNRYERRLGAKDQKPWFLLPLCVMRYRGGVASRLVLIAPSFDDLSQVEKSALLLIEMLIREGHQSGLKLIEPE